MQVKALDHGGRDDGRPARIEDKRQQVRRRFFTANSFGRTLERIVKRNLFQPGEWRGPALQRNTRQFTNANLRILQRRRLRVHSHIEAVGVVILVEENLRTLFGRDCLLDRIRKNLAKGQTRSDVDIGRREKSVRKIMHSVDMEARADLILMMRVFLWTKDSILHLVESNIE